jgi:AraC-like DNA-binding protein
MPQDALAIEPETQIARFAPGGGATVSPCESCSLARCTDFVALHKKAMTLISSRPKNSGTLLSMLALEILHAANRQIAPGSLPKPVTEVIEYMRSNLNRRISIAEFAGIADVCVSQLFRLFKAHLGQAPLAYFNTMKIKHASELLARTKMPINEIAVSLGYREAAYFTNQFRHMAGVSPRKFRIKNTLRQQEPAGQTAPLAHGEFQVFAA